MTQEKEQGLLQGYRALDLTDEKGAFCGRILADLGVDVIKVEKPGGDDSRNIGPFYQDSPHPERSLSWFAVNTNKRGITLDIEAAEGRDVFLKLVKNADFVIESFSPKYMEKLALGYSALSSINSRIITVSITPFGSEGPYADYKTSDLVSMAMGGWVFICGDEDRPPVRFSIDQAYLQAGAQAAIGALIAHYYREIEGIGQHVDVSIQEAITWLLTYPFYYWYVAQIIFARAGFRQKRMNVTYRRVYPCKDGYVSSMVGSGLMLGPMQERLVKLMDEEGKAGNLKGVDWRSTSFDNVTQEDMDRWEETLLQYFITKDKAELESLAVEHELFLNPVNDIKEVYEYSQLAERNYWKPIKHDELDRTFYYPGFWFLGDLFSPGPQKRAPLIGEHNDEIFIKELGFSKSVLEHWRKGRII